MRRNQRMHVPVGFVGVDVVGADHVHPRTEIRGHEFLELHQILVRRRTGINDVFRKLEAFILLRIEKQFVVLFNNRQHGFSAAGCIPPEYQIDLVFDDQALQRHLVARVVRLGVVVGRDNFPARNTA